MPELCRFYGITIRIYYGDHSPPHFHAIYEGDEVQINIDTLRVMKGEIRHRALMLVLEWAARHQAELLRAWHLASQNQQPDRIAPLE